MSTFDAEATRIEQAKTNIVDAIEMRGVRVPGDVKIDYLPTFILDIQGAGIDFVLQPTGNKLCELKLHANEPGLRIDHDVSAQEILNNFGESTPISLYVDGSPLPLIKLAVFVQNGGA